MNKVLLTHSYFLNFDPKQKKLGQPYAPLATLYAAALLRENGYGVAVVDVMFADGPDVVLSALNENPSCFVIYDDGFNYLTKMCLTNMREAAFRMIKLAKEKGCKVIVSSSDSTDRFGEYLEAGADFILLGEAEHTLLELITALDNKTENFSAIQGLAYKDEDGKALQTAKRAVLKDLDNLPLAAWDLIDVKPYRESWLKTAGYFSMNVVTTRGCPYKCNWCAKPIYGNRYNARSPENVVAELLFLKKKYRFDHIWFCDDIFGLKPEWVAKFADLVKQKGLLLKFKIQARADLLANENYVGSLAAAGCESVWMGAESGSQKILDAMDKGITLAQIEKANSLLKAHSIKSCFFIQFGYLGETKEDIQETVNMIHRLLPEQIGISVSYPLPGTVFYQKVKEELRSKTNWTDSDDLALLFTNTYQPKFYKQLHRYVHKSYRKAMAFAHLKQSLKHPLQTSFQSLKKIAAGLYYAPATLLEKRKLQRLEKAA